MKCSHGPPRPFGPYSAPQTPPRLSQRYFTTYLGEAVRVYEIFGETVRVYEIFARPAAPFRPNRRLTDCPSGTIQRISEKR